MSDFHLPTTINLTAKPRWSQVRFAWPFMPPGYVMHQWMLWSDGKMFVRRNNGRYW